MHTVQTMSSRQNLTICTICTYTVGKIGGRKFDSPTPKQPVILCPDCEYDVRAAKLPSNVPKHLLLSFLQIFSVQFYPLYMYIWCI